MKEQYIKQVEKELSLPHKAKKEVVRDLNEVFASALEHGETEQQVIQRLGTPKEFADSTAEQFGIDNASSKKRKGIISALVALIVAVVAFSGYTACIGRLRTGWHELGLAKWLELEALVVGAFVYRFRLFFYLEFCTAIFAI